jgi:hypothetical protein
MSNIRRISSAGLLTAGALLLSGEASAQMLLPASAGFAYDVSKTLCFPKDEPGRVHYKGSSCGNLIGIWHVALPMRHEFAHFEDFSVYARDSTAITTHCFATIMSLSGQALRWETVTTTNVAQWYDFESMLVSQNETAVIECDIANTTTGGTSWVGAVRHWAG